MHIDIRGECIIFVKPSFSKRKDSVICEVLLQVCGSYVLNFEYLNLQN